MKTSKYDLLCTFYEFSRKLDTTPFSEQKRVLLNENAVIMQDLLCLGVRTPTEHRIWRRLWAHIKDLQDYVYSFYDANPVRFALYM